VHLDRRPDDCLHDPVDPLIWPAPQNLVQS
jgi:hypothetical protein